MRISLQDRKETDVKIETKDQYKERFRRRGVKRAKKTRLSDTAGTPQPKWDGLARVERSSWQPNGVGEQPSWIKRIGL
jgi:hypothetical protein